MCTVKMLGFDHNRCYSGLLSLVLISDNGDILQVETWVYFFHKPPKFVPSGTVLIPEHNCKPNRGHITVCCDSIAGEQGIFPQIDMTRIYHEQSFHLGHSVWRKRWYELDAVEILDTITFPSKLVDDQLPILILPVVPKDLSFIDVEYTIVEIFPT